MLIETKFNVGDVLWFNTGVTDVKPNHSKVTKIEIIINNDKHVIIYHFDEYWGKPCRVENCVFKTKEDLLKK